MENRSHALLAGIFVILFGFLAGMAIWWLGQLDEDTNTYILETRGNVTGLNVQAAVRYRGIRAGKVVKIDTDPADPRVIQVYVAIDNRFPLTHGSTARLAYQGVTGLAYVLIEDDGSKPTPLKLGAGEAARLPLKPGFFENLGEQAVGLTEQVGVIAQRLAKVLDQGNLDNLARTLDNVATGTAGLRDSAREMPRLIAALREIVSPANLQRLQRSLAHLEKTSGEAAPLAAEMRELVKSMSALTTRIDALAADTGAEFNSTTLPRANQLMRELTVTSRQMNQLMEKLESNPQMMLFGSEAPRPGPGEAGFVAPTASPKETP